MKKAVPILVVTNVIAFGVAIMALVKVDEISSSPGSKRQSARRDVASGETQRLEAKVADLEAKLSRMSFDRGAAPAPSGEAGDGPASPEGKPIDRSYTAPEGGEFDAEAAIASPGFEDFRQRVKLAQEVNEREERVTRQVDRLNELISNNRIGALSDKQKKQAAETIIGAQDRTRLIWRGLMTREDLTSLPDEERRDAFRKAYREEQASIRTETQTTLEEMMPAADVQTLMEAARMGDRGARRSGRRGR